MGATPDRRGRPECRARIPVADARTYLKRPVLCIAARACCNRGPLYIGSQRRETALGMAVDPASRQDQSTVDADLPRDAVRLQNCTRDGSVPDNPGKRRVGADIDIAEHQ